MGSLALAFAACVGVPCVIFYLYIRHWLFAGLALWPPAAALAVVVACGGTFDTAANAALLGTFCALTLADESMRQVSAGATPRGIVLGAVRFVASSAGPVIAGYMIFLLASAALFGDGRKAAVTAALVTASVVAAFAGGILCAFFPFSEQSIAAANAAREWRERMFDRFFPEMQTRWAFSITGIAVILGAVAAFGIRDTHAYWTGHPNFCLAIFLLSALIGFAALARAWRMTAALVLTVSFDTALVLWSVSRLERYPDLYAASAMLALSSVPLAVLAVRARRQSREGDEVSASLGASVRDCGAVACALAIMTGLPGLFSTIASGVLSPALVFAVAMLFAALLLFPALTIVIHALVPRYRTVDEVFGRR
ncbi:MAG TPA: hypothetical protein VHE09_11335 [Rhizomicrobium sp.]|nr:hypothetical protein [Rhizomicrobium sp.]